MEGLVVVGKGISKYSVSNASLEQDAHAPSTSDSNSDKYSVADMGEPYQKNTFRPISVGVCGMNSKTMAPPMQNILERFKLQDYIKIEMFTDKIILEDPIEYWPICDCLIAFYSNGFPLEKAINYVSLRKPLVFNDLEMQYSLMDRREVYKILNANGVETPRYEIRSCDTEGSGCDGDAILNEIDDGLEINGHVFHKPFVEKPVSAEDHNIYIYFPSDYGGGSQRLFRKVKNRSSSYSAESSIRTRGSYIYEDFLATDGTDVKVYTVGPDYAHAEARKSPALDGKVERDESGKEVRYPVILTAKEKLIARAVSLAFKQTVCGFDLLRSNGRSYVCDVNGFSFVKNSQKYYDDCAQILLEMITAYLGPQYFPSIPPSVEYLMDEIPDMPVPIPRGGNDLELRCVVGVIRHGDRTPKQKMKMIVNHKRFFDLFRELKGYEMGQLKIKKPKLLQRVLDIARDLLTERADEPRGEIQEKTHKLEQLRTVLEMYGKFSGINRKLQFRLLNKKSQDEARLLLILKWGGEHTQSGQHQAEDLGRAFRIIYPGGAGEYASLPGSGFLRLHSTYRHDLKVYASDEGRVQMTAAAFSKGLLDLEGNAASVLVHLVKRDQAATNMLDTSTSAQDAMNSVKERLHALMKSQHDFSEQSYQELAPTGAEPVVTAMKKVVNPRQTCERLYTLVQSMVAQLRIVSESGKTYDLYDKETLQLMINRWGKLEKDFKLKDGHFDISKIPDIYDCIKYDLLHSNEVNSSIQKELLKCVMPLADIVISQEYGITKEEKLDIAHKICRPLLRKIQADFYHTIVNEQADVIHRLDHRISKGVVSPKRHVRTRLYFTSESHVHSLTNILRYDNLIQSELKDSTVNIHNVPELNYMTQIVFLLYEDMTQPERSDLRYHVKIHFSPGVRCRDEVTDTKGDTKKISSELNSKNAHLPFVKRLPAVIPLDNHGNDARRSSDQFSNTSFGKTADFTDQYRSKDLMTRRYSEQINNVPMLNTNASCKSKVSPTHLTRIKSFSETEVTVSGTSKQNSQLEDLSKSMESLDSHTQPLSSRSGSNMQQHSTVCRNRSVPTGVLVSSLAPAKMKEEQDEATGCTHNEQENTEKMRKPETEEKQLKNSSLGFMELSSTIYPLNCIGVVRLSTMNEYLTSLTGIHLDYDAEVHEDPPLTRMRTPGRRGSSEWLQSQNTFTDSLTNSRDNLTHQRDSMNILKEYRDKPHSQHSDRHDTSEGKDLFETEDNKEVPVFRRKSPETSSIDRVFMS